MAFGTGEKSTIYYVILGNMKYAFRAKKSTYDGIGPAMGVLTAKDTDDNLTFGANQPKPAKVRINMQGGKSVTRFADPSKLEELLVKGTLNKKKYNNKEINSVTVVQG